jgi:putative ABC transport system permease protein
MLQNYLKIALRNIKKHKGYTFLNIAGLAIGMAASILILLFVFHEMSYDRFHENADHIYRVSVRAMIGDTRIAQVFTPAILTPTLLKDYPEVLHSIRFQNFSRGVLVRRGDRVFNEQRVTLVDPEVFEVFSFPFIQGDPKSALVEPNTAVITVSTASKYFRDADPMGHRLTIGDQDFKITGIMEDIPENSHFHFDIFSSIVSSDGINSTAWLANNYKTYILLREGCLKTTFDEKLSEVVKEYIYRGQEEFWAKGGNYWEYYLQPVTEIHLTSDIHGEFEVNGNAAYVSIFTVIALFIILIASINYMNLSTARSSGRAREVGIRKVVGASRTPLIWQFLAESVVSSLIALALALLSVQLLLPLFRNLVGKQGLRIPYLEQPLVLLMLVGLALLIGVISGSYPAFWLSAFRPISVLSGRLRSASKNTWLRNVLVLIQFSISIFLFVGTIIVYRQLHYIQNKKLGFDKEHVVVIRTPQSLGDRSEPFKQALFQYPEIVAVSGSSTLPGMGFNNVGFIPEGEEQAITLNLICCDYGFMETLNFEMSAGRFFSREFTTDSSGIIINETTVTLLGWEDPLRMHLNAGNQELPVIGVVEDFHYESLHHSVRPGALLMLPGVYGWSERYISVRIRSENIRESLDLIRRTWDEFSAGLPFEYSFLDEEFDALYHNEQRTSRVFTIFSVLGIIISCMGLFGLASFAAEQKTQEIGIRKVFGASVPGLVFMLAREFTKWVIIANGVAWPMAYFAMNRWLRNFAYRTDFGWWTFALSGLIALLIALMTVSYQSVRAALANPVESIRYE